MKEPMPSGDAEGQARRGFRFDRRVRALAAGLSLHELRAMLRGDPPTARPNPRYRAHTNSFLLHVRPRTYPAAATRFTHTYFLGFFAVFLFAVEIVTGVLLMFFYAPTPEEAYQSILTIASETPFGELLRDVHRLAAEAMVVVVVLHMLRTFLTASYKGVRSFTWVTGVLLLVVTLLLSFSGYLLPWDQLAYWAVTIGTSMAAATPLIGPEVNLLLRGASDIGAMGLLRFYLLHVVLLPLAGILLLAVHYYRVARHHGISLPAAIEEGDLAPGERQRATQRIDFLPHLLLREVVLASTALLAMLLVAHSFYDAPLEQHADPFHTPFNTQAPWFFLWVQGLLKLGDKTLMGVIVPVVLLLLLIATPYLDRNPARRWQRRPLALALALVGLVTVVVLSYMGTASFGIELPPAMRIVETLAPEEGVGPLRRTPYAELTAGIYATDQPIPESVAPGLRPFLLTYAQLVAEATTHGELPDGQGWLEIVERQADLKAATIRIQWQPAGTAAPATYERTIYIHRLRSPAGVIQAP